MTPAKAYNVRVAEMTWPEYAERIGEDVVILPVGATEQHGLHLPLGADTYQADAVAEAVARRTNSIVAPAIAYGYKSHPSSGGGEIFAGTTSLQAHTIVDVTKDVLCQLLEDGARKLVVLSGHYENRMMLHEAIDRTLRSQTYHDAVILNALWADFLSADTLNRIFPAGFPGLALEHAAVIETSMLLHLRPELVRSDRIHRQQSANLPPYDRHPQPPDWVPASGSLSDPSGASAQTGRLIFDECVDGLTQMIEQEFGEKVARVP